MWILTDMVSALSYFQSICSRSCMHRLIIPRSHGSFFLRSVIIAASLLLQQIDVVFWAHWSWQVIHICQKIFDRLMHDPIHSVLFFIDNVGSSWSVWSIGTVGLLAEAWFKILSLIFFNHFQRVRTFSCGITISFCVLHILSKVLHRFYQRRPGSPRLGSESHARRFQASSLIRFCCRKVLCPEIVFTLCL